METCVLIPPELSLILRPHPDPTRLFEMSATIWTNLALPPGTFFFADQGIVKLDKLEVYSHLQDDDVRYRFGLIDEVLQIEGAKVRHCNWIRFLQSTDDATKANVVCFRVKGEPVIQVTKYLTPNSELIAVFEEDQAPPSPEAEEKECVEEYMKEDSENEAPLDVIATPEKDLSAPLDLCIRLSPEVKTTEQSSPGSVCTPSPRSLPSPTLVRSPGSEKDDDCRSTISEGSVGSDDSNSSNPIDPAAISPLPLPLPKPTVLSPNNSPWPPVPPMLHPALNRAAHIDKTPTSAPPVKRNRERTWLPCEVCGKKFDRPSLLKRHMRTHTGEKPHACDVCGKAFSTSSSLNTHRRIHSGEKPHQCQICGKRFTASSNLYYHRMTHKKEKPHKCTLCAKSFPTPGDLKSHMYVHNGSWPFRCDVCNRGFSKQTNLRNHMMLHTGEKPHQCELCNKKFALQCNLRTHMKTHQGDMKEECLRCGKSVLASQRLLAGGFCKECRPVENIKHPLQTSSTQLPRPSPAVGPHFSPPSTALPEGKVPVMNPGHLSTPSSSAASRPGRALFPLPTYANGVSPKVMASHPYGPFASPTSVSGVNPWNQMFDMYRSGLLSAWHGKAVEPK